MPLLKRALRWWISSVICRHPWVSLLLLIDQIPCHLLWSVIQVTWCPITPLNLRKLSSLQKLIGWLNTPFRSATALVNQPSKQSIKGETFLPRRLFMPSPPLYFNKKQSSLRKFRRNSLSRSCILSARIQSSLILMHLNCSDWWRMILRLWLLLAVMESDAAKMNCLPPLSSSIFAVNITLSPAQKIVFHFFVIIVRVKCALELRV